VDEMFLYSGSSDREEKVKVVVMVQAKSKEVVTI